MPDELTHSGENQQRIRDNHDYKINLVALIIKLLEVVEVDSEGPEGARVAVLNILQPLKPVLRKIEHAFGKEYAIGLQQDHHQHDWKPDNAEFEFLALKAGMRVLDLRLRNWVSYEHYYNDQVVEYNHCLAYDEIWFVIFNDETFGGSINIRDIIEIRPDFGKFIIECHAPTRLAFLAV